LKESEDHNPFDDEEEPDKDMGDDFGDLDDVFDNRDDDFDDFGEASIHPLTLKGGEENIMYPEGFGEEDDLN